MSYFPNYKVEVWPEDDPESLTPTEIFIANGKVTFGTSELAREFTFSLPTDYTFLPDDYAASTAQALKRGVRIRVSATEDNFTTSWVIFDGWLHEYTEAREGGDASLEYVCRDKLAQARSNGIDKNRSTRMKFYSVPWDSAGTEWNATDPDFLVDIPDNSEEWVPKGLISLTSQLDTAIDGDLQPHEYTRDEFTYSATKKQIYFHASQADAKAEGRTWTVKLYFYDPTDNSNSVKNLLTDMATGAPWSREGGLGYEAADVDLEEIYGFDGVTPKRLRTEKRGKTDGPIAQYLDTLRDNGVLPVNYYLRHDPVTGKLTGSHLVQDNGSTVIPRGVISDSQPQTMESIGGRIECHSLAGTPEDYALNADITINGGAPLSGYTTTGTGAELTDGKPDTGISVHKEWTTLEVDPKTTADDFIVADLHEQKTVGRVQLTQWRTAKPGGEDWEYRNYLISRQAKYTISGSNEPINSSNPGVPISDEAINAEVDAENIGANRGVDLDIETKDLSKFRYLAIRGEQDLFFRAVDSNSLSGTVIRPSGWWLSALKILSDGKFRYLSGPDRGDVPYAQLSDKGGTISNIASTTLTLGAGHNLKGRDITLIASLTLTVGAGHPFAEGDVVYFWDTTGATYFEGASIVTAIAATTITVDRVPDDLATGDLVGDLVQFYDVSGSTVFSGYTGISDSDSTTITLPFLPGALTVGDKAGWHKRWVLDLSGVWTDTYFPKLAAKIKRTTNWLDILEDDQPQDISEAEGLCLSRLIELASISKEHKATILLDSNIDIGVTVEMYSGETPWLLNGSITYNLNPLNEANTPLVTMDIDGGNYDEAPQ